MVDNPESNSFPLFGSLYPVPDVTVCEAVLSLSVHVTLLPNLTLIRFGEKALPAKVAAPGIIDTSLPPAEAAVIFAVLILMYLRDGGVSSSVGSVMTGLGGRL
jgi:hypothetical protein